MSEKACELTICNPHPRPKPARIWKPIHVPVDEVEVSELMRPVPIVAIAVLVIIHGK
jgi:hypothetical protein